MEPRPDLSVSCRDGSQSGGEGPDFSENSMKTELVALKGRLYTKSFKLAEGQKLVIGRGHDVDIHILDTGLSRQHCSLERSGGSFTVEDLSSRNGTWVNGERIERHELEHGDRVRFGGVEFEFRSEPDRRRTQADIVAAVPEMPGRELKERVKLEGSDLMELPAKFENIENFRRVQRALGTIYNVGNLISGEADLSRLHERIIDAIFRVVHADRAFLLIENSETGDLDTAAQREKRTLPHAETTRGFSRTIVEETLREGTSILRANALIDERYGHAESVISQNIHSVICVPVESAERIVGAIYADTVGESEAFARTDLELLAAVGKQAGVAVQRTRLAHQVQEMLYGTVRALVASIEAKDEYTKGHSERVTAYALKIGTAMNLDETKLRTLELAGFLHDVGKIGVPENILRKAGPLTEGEYEIIKQHPKQGEKILRHLEGAQEMAEVVLHHHERWDGTGYPDGLAAGKPSLLARVLAVADAFDAMGSQRPYRDRLAEEKVLEQIRRGAGNQFDPKVAEVLLREAEAGRISLQPQDRAPDPSAAQRDEGE